MPTIAAEQNQEMQKASANTITTASEDDFVLGIYGNANEDDTIDMRDLTYVKLIFFGKKPETELADAKYDGKINPLDFIQIKLIIVGKEKELTFIDSDGGTVTVSMPIKRIVVIHPCPAEAIQVLNVREKVVCVSTSIAQQRKVSFPEISKLPSVGTSFNLDYEAILNANPDVVLTLFRKPEIMEHLPESIVTIGLGFNDITLMREQFEKLGYILDRENEAKEFIDFYDDYIDGIKSRTERLSEDEKPRLYFGFGSRGGEDFYVSTLNLDECDIAGGRNIVTGTEFPSYPGFPGCPQVDPEWVIDQNPDIIIVGGWGTPGGYQTDDPSGMKDLRNAIINRPELTNVNAVKNGKVYAIHYDAVTGPGKCIIGTTYYAKWLHPELFKDLDPQAIHQEYIDRFKRIDFNVYEDGVFVYPPLED
jgi:iron complex transport system substrate-binding protein